MPLENNKGNKEMIAPTKENVNPEKVTQVGKLTEDIIAIAQKVSKEVSSDQFAQVFAAIIDITYRN